MKGTTIYILLLLLLMPGKCFVAGQSANSSPLICKERIALFTDRSMYIAGEKILFSAGLINLENECSGASAVLYCELITPDGLRINAGKYLIADFHSSGSMDIPADAISGIYYMKAYTRYMRNEGPESYDFTMVTIINPDSKEVLPADENDTVNYFAFEPEIVESSSNIVISTGSYYSKRDSVTLRLTSYLGPADSLISSCLSVAPVFSFSLPDKQIATADKNNNPGIYYPETRGLALTGLVNDHASGKPLPNALVHLSVIGEKDIMAMRTDTAGRFSFNISGQEGKSDIFICSEKLPGANPDIFVDNDFCTKTLTLPSPKLEWSEERKLTAEQLVRNYRISALFGSIPLMPETTPENQFYSFYGIPGEVINLDKYIDLPSIEEYFNELPSQVKIRKIQNRKVFRFSSTQAEMLIYDPLVLIDWVAVDDIDRILAISPRDISKIELINAPYIKGQVMYGGVINFISKKFDFARIDLPESGIFIHYQFLDSPGKPLDGPKLMAHIPDAKNTAYWNPNILPGNQKNAEITFIAPDTPGTYLVLFRAVTSKGDKIITYNMFEIK